MKNKIIFTAMLLSALCFSGCGKHHDTKPAPVNYTQISYSGHTFVPKGAFISDITPPVVIGDKIIFGGDKLHIYNVKTSKWTSVNEGKLSGSSPATVLGNTLFFYTPGGKEVYTYDIETNKWTSIGQLSKGRYNIAAAAAGNKVVFAGGLVPDMYSELQETNIVDIYDLRTHKWTTTTLSKTGDCLIMATAAAGNKIVFAGEHGYGSATVDIYDVTTDTWTTAQLSEARGNLAAAATADKIFFAGGGGKGSGFSSTVDIYNVKTDTWTTAQLSEARAGLAGAANGNIVVFAGGYKGNNGIDSYSKTVDIYDIVQNTWSTAQLSEDRMRLVGAAAGNKIIFAGGYNPGASNIMDIFTLSK